MMRLKKSREVQSVLKERLQEHSRVTKAMERIMKNLQDIQEEEFFYNLVALKALAIEHVTSKCLQFTNDDVFDVLDERISARQSNLEATLQAKWQEGFIQDSDEVSMNASSGGLELELIKTRMMPFSVENTWSSLWETFHFGMESSSRAGVQVAWRSKTTMTLNALYPVALETGDTVNVHVLVVIKGFVVSGGFAAMLEATVGYFTSSVSPRYVTQDSSVILLRSQSFNAKGMKPGVKLHGCQMCLSIKICSSQVNQQHTDENELSEVDVIVPSLRKIVDSRHQIIDNTALTRI